MDLLKFVGCDSVLDSGDSDDSGVVSRVRSVFESSSRGRGSVVDSGSEVSVLSGGSGTMSVTVS